MRSIEESGRRGPYRQASPSPARHRPGGPVCAPTFAEAFARWQLAGVDTSSLGAIDIRIADLGGASLGPASGHTIWLDANAAGCRRFVDPTPWDDSEFTAPGKQGEQHGIGIANGKEAAARDHVFADFGSAPFHDTVWDGPALDWI